MKKQLLYIIICLIGAGVGSSCRGPKLATANEQMERGEYFDASKTYRKIYNQLTKREERPLRGEVAYKMAECHRRLNQYARASAAYQNAARYGYSDSTLYLHLGQMLMAEGKYGPAVKALEDYLAWKPNDRLAENTLAGARMGLAKEGQTRYIVRNAKLFNSRRADYSPMYLDKSLDQLYFTTTTEKSTGNHRSEITGMKKGDIWFATKNERGEWKRPEPVEGELNTEVDEGTPAFTPDGQTMYLSRARRELNSNTGVEIYTSQRSDAKWSAPVKFEITADTISSYAHPAVSPDGNWLYFTSDMPGGHGGRDIWRINLRERAGSLENLGEWINTPGDEMFPTFRPNGDLYFSSDGHPGMGGLDIYIAKPDTVMQGWKIEHPGFPLNSQGDDFGMTFEGLHNRGFFSSNRGDGKGWDHIYSFENPEIVQTVKGWVYEQDGYELPEALVYMVGNDGTNLKLSVKGDGSFTQQINPNVDYVFLGTCKGFLNHKEQLRVEPVGKSEEYVLQFPLASITSPVLIDNIFYDFDKATLRPESTAALDELIKLLNENPNVTIELSAHCDYRGPEAYNKLLSQRRAESVVAYLTEHGIAADRLSPVGYGKEKPKTIRKKLTEKIPFLKADDVLTEEYIKKLPEDQQEICNQLNRRTEFIVLRTTYGMFDKEGNLKNPPKRDAAKEAADDDGFDDLF